MFTNFVQFVGREPADNLVIGFSALLEWCLDLANGAGVTLNTLYVLIVHLIKYARMPNLFLGTSPRTSSISTCSPTFLRIRRSV